MSSSDRRSVLFALAALPVLGACGFEPLYSEGGTAARLRNQVAVAAIPGREGYFLRQRLLRRFGTPVAEPQYELRVRYTTTARALTITSANDTVRLSILGSGAFEFVDRTTRQVLATDTVTADASYAAPSGSGVIVTPSPAAARVAAEDAEERVANAVAEGIADRVLLLTDQTAL